MKLHLIAASHRVDSANRKLLHHAGEIMATHLVSQGGSSTLTHHEYGAFDLPLYNDANRLANGIPSSVNVAAELLRPAEAMLLAVPEYNWSYPASVKNIIDWFSCMKDSPLKGKPVFMMCATPSERGGMMCLSHLKTVLEYMGMWVYPQMFGLGSEHMQWENTHGESGTLIPGKQKLLESQLAGFNDFCRKFIA